MTELDICRAAYPQANKAFADHILWGRTCFPFGKVTARDLYRAASGMARATAKGIHLCDFCERALAPDKWTCDGCDKALRAGRDEP